MKLTMAKQRIYREDLEIWMKIMKEGLATDPNAELNPETFLNDVAEGKREATKEQIESVKRVKQHFTSENVG